MLELMLHVEQPHPNYAGDNGNRQMYEQERPYADPPHHARHDKRDRAVGCHGADPGKQAFPRQAKWQAMAQDEQIDGTDAKHDLPAVLRWFTANIGVHHVHHLCSRIPFYRLRLVLRQHPGLADVGRLSLRQSLACVRLALWDEAASRLISFRELRAQLEAGALDGR